MRSKILQIGLCTFAIISFLFFNSSMEAHANKKKLISIAATGASSSFYAYHVAVSQLLNKKVPDIQISVLETGGSRDNLKRIARGEADWGQFSEPTLFEIYSGKGSWKGKEKSEMRLLWLVNPGVYMYVVSKKSGVKTLQDLEGKKFCPGARGSGTEKRTQTMLGLLGIKPDYFRASYGDAVHAIKDRRIIGYAKGGSSNAPDATVLDVSSVIPIQILSFKEKDIQKIKSRFPYWGFVTVPAGLYQGVEEFTTRAVFLAIGGTKNLDEDLVYKVVKTVSENVDFQAKSFPGVKGINIPEFTLRNGQAPLHPGSIKYFREKGLTIPDRLIPPEMK